MHHHDVYCDNDMHISDFVLTSLANCTFESVALHIKNFTVSVHILFALCDEFPDIWRSIGKVVHRSPNCRTWRVAPVYIHIYYNCVLTILIRHFILGLQYSRI